MPDVSAIPRADYLSPADLASLQERRWRKQATYVREHSSFYKRLNLTGRLGELADLPFTDKETLRADQRAYPPFGSYLAAPPTLSPASIVLRARPGPR